MTNAARKMLAEFKTLSKQAQEEVLISLLRLPIEVPYTVPSEEQLRHAADAIFMDLDGREAQP